MNFEKEERWINEMAARGLHLIHYSFLNYLFEEGRPGEYIYRLELLEELPSHPASKAYIRFMEESGVECVCTYLRWAYFRKRAADGPFEIYTDTDSKIRHFKRLASFVGVLGFSNLFCGVSNTAMVISDLSTRGLRLNGYVSILNLTISAILLTLFAGYVRRIHKLKREKIVRE